MSETVEDARLDVLRARAGAKLSGTPSPGVSTHELAALLLAGKDLPLRISMSTEDHTCAGDLSAVILDWAGEYEGTGEPNFIALQGAADV